jgi:sigma-B regulation protein RsbU (phosphoserine phosphatase)
VRNNEAIPLDTGGLILGSFPYPEYEEAQVNLQSGDILAFYTDGVTEARNDDGEEFGPERLVELVRTYRELGAMEMVRRICRDVHNFQSDKFSPDDLTLSIVKCQ